MTPATVAVGREAARRVRAHRAGGGADRRDLGLHARSCPSALVAAVVVMVIPLPALLHRPAARGVDLAVARHPDGGMYTQQPLEFSTFPSVLLVVTLFRLALNVASTRLILLHGHEGPAAAGHVIQAFGNFVVGGSYVVGLVVFLILVVINFAVITKGAGPHRRGGGALHAWTPCPASSSPSTPT